MDKIAYIKILFVWLPQAVAQVLVWTYWIQQKEYRLDRFKVLLKTKSGIKRLMTNVIGVKLLMIIIFSSGPFPFLTFVALDMYWIYRLIRRTLQRPNFTQRTRRILRFTGIGTLIIIFMPILGLYQLRVAFLLAELYLILGIIGGVIWTKKFVDEAKERDVKAAHKKLVRINPQVIGITGSYGKTTTKEFLAALLDNKFNTQKTTKNQNNEFGVARKILNDFPEDTQLFVVEMGAYTKGEVKMIADFTNPTIGVITGLEPQHLEMFGTFEDVKIAKFELIKALPKGGLAIFNSTNLEVEKLAKKAEKLASKLKVVRYKRVNVLSKNLAKDVAEVIIIKRSAKGIVFKIHYGGKMKTFETKIQGDHFVENLTGAMIVANTCGVSWNEIEEIVKIIELPDGTMSTYQLESGLTVIDDSYNSTPKGFNSALDYLESYGPNVRKIVVTPGIIELGSYSQIIHNELGERMSGVISRIILTNNDFESDIVKGLGDYRENLKVISKPHLLTCEFEYLNKAETVVLLEGRMPTDLMNKLEELK